MLETLASTLRKEVDIDVVRVVSDPAETVSVATSTAPDIVGIDEELAGRASLDHVREVIAALSGVHVLVLCMHAVRSFVSEMRETGASGYLPKDRAVEDLARAIRTVARSDFYVSPRVVRGDRSHRSCANGTARASCQETP